MATVDMTKPEIKPTLGLLGATVNAMALIAPGAFLWITYQLQAAATAPNGTSVSSDIWAGIVAALVIAFLTAISYAELAKIYPEAGFKSCCYFVEKAFGGLKRKKKEGCPEGCAEGSSDERRKPFTLTRFAKLITAWSAHLFYWVYPGVMVAFMANLIGYLYTQFTGHTFSMGTLTGIGVVFAFACAYIAYRGVTGSTKTAFWINVIQLVTLVIFSGLAIWYRIANPQHATQWSFTGGWDVIRPHSLYGVLIQSTVAILILVGFESCTALSAETKEPEKTIPKAIILSLVIQGIFAYLFQYFAAGLMVSEKLVGTAAGKAVMGLDAAAASGAPIGDMAKLLGDNLLGGIGFGLMITMAITVAIAIIGTTLSCMNTAVRVSCAMAEDKEFPELLGFMDGQFSTPHVALWVLAIVSSIIAAVGVRSVVGLTGITLASNLGTFVLYAMTCISAFLAFKDRADFKVIKHAVIPGLGLITNLIMVVAIVYLYIIGNSDAQAEAKICFIIAGAWGFISLFYVAMTTMNKSYHLKMVSGVIRPEQLNLVVEALRQEDYIMGMTVTKVRGFGRQKGQVIGDAETNRINFLPKVRVDVVVKEWDVPTVMDIMSEAARTGNVGDGKIFVLDASQARRIRTSDDGVWAI
ncbi:MAG: amino acid permease [Candidatus Omnitrophica bacterium]|nr:amino acid permease [Candidatus Omnitrophota bacterium]